MTKVNSCHSGGNLKWDQYIIKNKAPSISKKLLKIKELFKSTT
jgi:hypothetical protein